MSEKFLKFPKDFFWGAATSAHQVEGNTDNDWTTWEKSPERLAKLKGEGKDPVDFISGLACDHYNRYRDDFDIAQRLGHNMHRFSVEWSRVEPREGEFDYEVLQHYKDVVKALKGRGMEPMVTLWHFTTPNWLAVKGGVLNKRFPELYKRFISQVVDNLKGDVHYWITFNEATTVYAGKAYLQGNWPPQEKNLWHWLMYRRNVKKAHILAYREIKNHYRDWVADSSGSSITSHNIGKVFIGAVENISYVVMPKWARVVGAEKVINYAYYHWLWLQTLPYQDFLGLNYYTYKLLPYMKRPTTDYVEEMDWGVYPEGLYKCLANLKRLKLPIFITENGTPDDSDVRREKFIKDHLQWLWRAIDDGIDIRGYLHWSLLDNFEWASGFGPRFGLVRVDYATQQRTIRPSAWYYAKIAKDNGLRASNP